MDRMRGTCKRRDKCIWNVGWKTWKKVDLGDQGVDGSIVVLCTFKKQEYGAGSILIL
jgi:hypothetical protein